MLYKKNNSSCLSNELFRNPTAEYRGAPFWSWNCELDEKELLRQIEELKKMGFGGFHIHCRSGMATDYLGEEYMKLVKACVKKSKKEDMLTWLYDEDRWPSGYAGGLVTKDKKYRKRLLVFSPVPKKDGETINLKGYGDVCDVLMDFGRYDVILNEKGELLKYNKLDEKSQPDGTVFYAYETVLEPTPRFNNQGYADVLNPETIKCFIDITHEAYKKAVGNEFNKTIPAIFTDEPQFARKARLKFATDKDPIVLPWTDDLEQSYQAKYGESLVDKLPEIIWNLPDDKISLSRYQFHIHLCERFVESFSEQLGDWCENNNIALTGHIIAEENLKLQTERVGEIMPLYKGFQIPGIDMLCAKYEYNTAKQCQSAVRQYGREGMMSELYGVTTWDFDFRGFKISGDWQAAMGVTVRVPHLAWVSMEGEAKRDYPPAIGYQSPWYEKFGYIEDHFSRLNTALTRGKPIVRIGVIHPIESYWINYGPEEQSAIILDELDANFENVNKWLTFGGYDFDYICETTLPELCEKGGNPLKVGEMAYDAIVVPACETLRHTTIERLEAFRLAGGKLIFMGNAPRLMDAIPSEVPADLYNSSTSIAFSQSALVSALDDVREIELRRADGAYTDDLLYQMRQDGNDRWVFICKGKFPYNKDISKKYKLRIKIKGEWNARLYDTQTGDILYQCAQVKNGWTYISKVVYDYDSFLFRLSPFNDNGVIEDTTTANKPAESVSISVPSTIPFTLGEPNALLLDMAEYALDGETYNAREELLRADTECRKRLGWPVLSGGAAQPWCIEKEPITHTIKLRFRINSEIRVYGASLAIENPDKAEIVWNGRPISNRAKGYYVDRSIKTVRIPVINKGENILELTLPFGKRTATEWCYILGTFGVRVVGSNSCIVPLPQKLGHSDIVPQGLTFYSGSIEYHYDVDIPEAYDGYELSVRAPQYRGALIEAILDGETVGEIVYPPYKLSLGKVLPGKHRVTLRLYVPRTNGFGPLHLSDSERNWINPGAWRTGGDSFSYEYHFKPEGIMMQPTLELIRNITN